MATILPGFMGYLNFAGLGIPFDSASVARDQSLFLPDLMVGDPDRIGWAYGQRLVTGSFSGPIPVADVSNLWAWAFSRNADGTLTNSGDLTIEYFYDEGIIWENCKINSMSFSVSAGDIANYSIDVMGLGEGSGTVGRMDCEDTTPTLITWRECAFGSTPFISGFEISIANNLQPAFVVSSAANFYPDALVESPRTITGNIQQYGVDVPPANGNVTVSFGSFNINAQNVIFHGRAPAANPSTVISTYNYTAVCDQEL